MCQLIWKIIIRNNYGEEPATYDESASDREKECFMRVDTYGKFAATQDDFFERSAPAGLQNLVRRLSLRIGVPPADDEDDFHCIWWDILFCMQGASLSACQTPPAPSLEKHDPAGMLFAGRQRPLKIDLAWIRKWLQTCDSEHRGLCSKKRGLFEPAGAPRSATHGRRDLYPDIRLINAITRCIESYTADEKSDHGGIPSYAALSYVWGNDQRLKLFQANEKLLSREDALRDQRPSETIVDAMDLVEQLNLPSVKHLWVDALCIMQDSPVDKKRQIGKMGRIYNDAAFTVMAAAGDDADSGLPGLRDGSRTVRQMSVPVIAPHTHVQGNDGLTYHEYGLAVMETLNPLMVESDDYWTYAKYSSRGWCMQEKVLSTRNIIFTEEQVYYECPADTFCEESIMECTSAKFQTTYTGANIYSASVGKLTDVQASPEDRTPSMDQRSITPSGSFWGEFSALASRFSALEFTFEGDALDGFSGIMQTISASTGEEFLWGMPLSRFALSLLWEDHDEGVLDQYQMRRRITRTTLPVTSVEKCLKYPTWSWLAWTGGVGLNLLDDKGAMRVPEITCYTTEPGGKVLTKVVSKARSKFPWTRRTDEEQDTLRAGWELSTDRTVTLDHIAQQLPSLYGLLPTVPEGILLLFWTSISSFRVGTFDDIRDNDGRLKIFSPKPPSAGDSDYWNYRKGPIIDNEQHYWVGSLFSKGDREHNESLHRRRVEGISDDAEGISDFIVVGRTSAKRQLSSQPRSLIVMGIGWPYDPIIGGLNAVGMRKGLGTINEAAWVASKPTWRLVALG